MKARWLFVLGLIACNGGRPGPVSPRAPDSAVPPARVAAAPPQPAQPSAAKPRAPILPDAAPPQGEAELPLEEQEANPDSETVTLRLSISPPARGEVLWGQRRMGRFSPAAMDLEFTRPRGSGPLDLELRAEGFLIHHTRLFADRNDKTTVRLYRAEDAVGLLGYQPPPDPK
jgi:hypothetical protein